MISLRQISRSRLVGTGSVLLGRLQLVSGARQVSAPETNRLLLMSLLLCVAAAQHVDNICPSSCGAACGKPAVHREVWFSVVSMLASVISAEL